MKYINDAASKEDVSTLTFHNDPGHGWCQVPISLLFELGIHTDISPYSYGQNGWAYLEEDLDFFVLCKAMRETTLNARIHDLNTNDYSPIRDMDTIVETLKRFDPDAETEFMVKVLGTGTRVSDGATVEVTYTESITSTPRTVRSSISDYLKNSFHALMLEKEVSIKEAGVQDHVYVVNGDKSLTIFPILLTVCDY